MKETILIIESGATKSAWAWIRDGILTGASTFPGIHPFFLTDAGLEQAFREGAEGYDSSLQAIFYYGTGCNSQSSKDRIAAALQVVFPLAKEVKVNTDLLAAARALCQRDPGIACILGTGSNSALYDGDQIVRTAGGLGFILGDEGSGADLGKTWISAWLYAETPGDLSSHFLREFPVSRDTIIEAVYRLEYPSRYLAEFARFIGQHKTHPFMRNLVKTRFDLFLQRHIPILSPDAILPVFFTGSVAVHFSEILEDSLRDFGYPLGKIEGDPVKGLAVFHSR